MPRLLQSLHLFSSGLGFGFVSVRPLAKETWHGSPEAIIAEDVTQRAPRQEARPGSRAEKPVLGAAFLALAAPFSVARLCPRLRLLPPAIATARTTVNRNRPEWLPAGPSSLPGPLFLVSALGGCEIGLSAAVLPYRDHMLHAACFRDRVERHFGRAGG